MGSCGGGVQLRRSCGVTVVGYGGCNGWGAPSSGRAFKISMARTDLSRSVAGPLGHNAAFPSPPSSLFYVYEATVVELVLEIECERARVCGLPTTSIRPAERTHQLMLGIYGPWPPHPAPHPNPSASPRTPPHLYQRLPPSSGTRALAPYPQAAGSYRASNKGWLKI